MKLLNRYTTTPEPEAGGDGAVAHGVAVPLHEQDPRGREVAMELVGMKSEVEVEL